MSKKNEGGGSESKSGTGPLPNRFEKGGYQPANEGYTADSTSTKGYSATNSNTQGLPKAPEGGTGVTPPATDQSTNDSKG